MDSRSTRRAWTILAALITLGLIVTACAGGGPAAAPDERAAVGVADPAAPPGEGDAGAGGGAVAEDGGGDFAAGPAVEARIIKVGDIAIEVEDVQDGLRAVRSLATELGGYVGSSQASDSESGATLTLRIPADRFEDALARVREFGELLNESTHEQDVTSAVIDLEARIENLRASEETYRQLLARAQTIEEILAVQTRLDEVRGEIEVLEGEAAYLNEQADLSTLTVSLVPTPLESTAEEWNPGQTVGQAVAALLVVGQGLVTVVIWSAIVLLPLLAVLGLIVLVVLRALEVFRRRQPAA